MVVYALGSNGSGQLGICHERDVAVPTRHGISFHGETAQPVTIVGGGNHTLILTAAGELFASGDLAEHSHSPLLRQKTPSPQTVLLAKDVTLCSATWEASVISHASGGLTTHGNGDRGELGRDALATHSAAVDLPIDPTVGHLGARPGVVDVASGVQHTVVVLDDGQVFGWGNGRKGQLGQPPGIITRPRRIDGIDFKVRRAVCGREFTYLVGDASQGHHAVLGSDKWGVRSRAPLSATGWTQIGACWGSIYVLLQSGKLLSWGRDDHGQLAASNLPPLSTIACGSEHCLALTGQGKVLAWGWGEHGNCGSPIDSAGDAKPSWNELQLPEMSGEAVGIGAGCATSWIWTSPTDQDG